MNRVVLDTNVLVSSALGGLLETILDKWADGAFTLIVTSDILAEYLVVLQRPKFKLKQGTLDRITRYLYQFSEFVLPQESIQVIEADPTDNKFLEAAIAAQADVVVSGDRHLLGLQEFRSIRIITAREFIDSLTGE
jgi:putative PIN family toxin of toxin-antitoxin system